MSIFQKKDSKNSGSAIVAEPPSRAALSYAFFTDSHSSTSLSLSEPV